MDQVYDTLSAAIVCRGDMPDEITALASISDADDGVHVAAAQENGVVKLLHCS